MAKTASSNSIRGQYFPPQSAEPLPADLVRRGRRFTLKPAKGKSATVTIKSIQGMRDVYFTDGRYFHAGRDLPPEFIAATRSPVARVVDGLMVFTPMRAAILAAGVVLTAMFFRLVYGLAVTWAVASFPPDWEAVVGRTAYAEMDEFFGLAPSAVDPARQARLIEAAEAMARTHGLDPPPEIYFRFGGLLGINAFALPGGPVVMTDALTEILNDEEALAVIAHEYAHVEKRHALDQTIRIGGIFVLASVLLGSYEGAVEAPISAGILLVRLGNSRAHESEADALAVEIMRKAGHDPIALATALEALERETCAAEDLEIEECRELEVFTGWIGTHPLTPDRIATIRALAAAQ